MIQKVSDSVNKVAEYTTGAFLLFMVIIIFFQVIFRYVFANSISWSEEMARYLFIWITMLGISIGVKRGFLVAVTIFVDSFNERFKKWNTGFIHLMILGFAIVMFFYGFELAVKVQSQLSPSMRIPMSFVYSSIPVSGLFMIIHIFNAFFTKKGKED